MFLIPKSSFKKFDPERSCFVLNEFALHQNYPNPFNAATSIDFSLAHTARVNLSIFDISGQKVHTLVDETLGAGRHTVRWPGVGSNGQIVASGAYFYRLRTDRASETKRLILLK